MSSNPEEPEQLTADDMAWSNMSYSERLVWWVNNKVLAKPANTEETTVQEIESGKPQVESEQAEAQEEVAQEVAQEVPAAESVSESPVKKRSSKGKKINISLE